MLDVPVVAWPLDQWLASTSSARSSYYEWDPETRPKTVRVGRRRLVVESPSDWLRRMALLEASRKQLAGRKRRARRSSSTDESAAAPMAASEQS